MNRLTMVVLACAGLCATACTSNSAADSFPPVQPNAGGRPGPTAAGSGGGASGAPIAGSPAVAGGGTTSVASGAAAGSVAVPVAGAAAMPTVPTQPIDPTPAPTAMTTDPGTEPWKMVPEDQLATECRLDLAALRKAESELPSNRSFAVVRYGKFCFRSKNDSPAEIWSTTKTLGAVMVGRAMHETRMIPMAGPKSGPLTEFQRVDYWLDSFTFNKDATVAHVLAMEAHNANLAYGQKMHSYDATGNVQINRLVDVVRTAISQDAPRLAGGDVAKFMETFVFDKLGMEQSRWGMPTIIGYSWNAVLDDMARLGLLVLNGGVWAGERLLSTDYVYNMTHASFEDGSRDYGYLTWVAPPPCTPRAIHRKYPHGPLSMAPDCGQSSCQQKHDVGIWFAGGLGGQFIMGHRGLDMVIVGKNWGEGETDIFWDAIRPAVVAADPMYKGDDQAFCAAYSTGDYAPDLKLWEGGI